MSKNLTLPDKTIHYFWFGNQQKPESFQLAIDSWRKHYPEYYIQEWNHSNYDTQKHPYMKLAEKLRKWAFVSDYARLDVLHTYGGIYFDVDVVVNRRLEDHFMQHNVVMGFESDDFINGAIIFAKKESSFLAKVLAYYDQCSKPITIPKVISQAAKDESVVLNGETQTVNGNLFLQKENFYGDSGYTVHLSNHSWQPTLHKLLKKLKMLRVAVFIKNKLKTVFNLFDYLFEYIRRSRRALLYVNRDLGFVLVTKTACSSLKKVIINKEVPGAWSSSKTPHQLLRHKMLHPKEYLRRMPSESILVVRNPFERVVSAYNHLYSEKNYPSFLPSMFYFGRVNYSFKTFLKLIETCPVWALDPHMVSTYELSHFKNQQLFNHVYKLENINEVHIRHLKKIGYQAIGYENVRGKKSWQTFYDRECFEIASRIYDKDVHFFNFLKEKEQLENYITDISKHETDS